MYYIEEVTNVYHILKEQRRATKQEHDIITGYFRKDHVFFWRTVRIFVEGLLLIAIIILLQLAGTGEVSKIFIGVTSGIVMGFVVYVIMSIYQQYVRKEESPLYLQNGIIRRIMRKGVGFPDMTMDVVIKKNGMVMITRMIFENKVKVSEGDRIIIAISEERILVITEKDYEKMMEIIVDENEEIEIIQE